MRKYNYHLTDKAIEGTKLEILADPEAVMLVIKADTEEASYEIGMAKINMENWELDHVSEA